MAQEILFEMRGAALIVTFTRTAQKNAFTPDMAVQLFNRLKLATTDRGVRALLFRGAGGTFISALDMHLYANPNTDVALANANQMMQHYHAAIREMQVMEKPVLSAVEGMVSGPGMSLMLASDFTLAARSTKLNCGFSSIGLSPDGGATHFLARKVGALKASELLMLSEDFTPESAEKWGLINAVVDDDKFQAVSLEWIDKLANGPTRAYGGVKRLVQKAFEQDLNAQLALEHTNWGATTRSFDFREAIKAHFASRPAKFTGA